MESHKEQSGNQIAYNQATGLQHLANWRRFSRALVLGSLHRQSCLC